MRLVEVRRYLSTFISVATAALLLGACGGGDEEEGTGAAKPVGGEFVGQVSGGPEFVAVVADPAGQSGEREVRAYVCDGTATGEAEWYKGSSAGNEFELGSATGETEIQVSLTPERSNGTVTLADGKILSFTAAPAEDGAGLYHVRQTADGRWFGESEGGAKIEARDRSGRRVIGKVTLPDGSSIDYKVRQVPGSGGPDKYTAIVIPPDGVKGRGGDVIAGSPSSRTYTAAFL
jgi:hypothetical protein